MSPTCYVRRALSSPQIAFGVIEIGSLREPQCVLWRHCAYRKDAVRIVETLRATSLPVFTEHAVRMQARGASPTLPPIHLYKFYAIKDTVYLCGNLTDLFLPELPQ